MSEIRTLLPGLGQVVFPTAGPEALFGGAGFMLSTRERALESIQPSTVYAANVVADISTIFPLTGALNVPHPDPEPLRPHPVPPISNSDVDTKPIQIWEGVVVGLDASADTMDVRLAAKIGNVPDHLATINIEWVTEQDRDLVKLGAVFYLTLFKRRSRGSIQNAQEIRFRRLPDWSRSQVKSVEVRAEQLLKRMTLGLESAGD